MRLGECEVFDFVLGTAGVTCALTGVYLQPYGSPWLGIASSWHREGLIDIGIEGKRGNSFVRKGSRLEVKRGTIIGASCELFSAVEKTEQGRRDVNIDRGIKSDKSHFQQ